MNDKQWNDLLAVLGGVCLPRLPVGFIIDSPWLPNWCGLSITDYLASEELWFNANRQAQETFPDVWFLPGYWSEFGMCTEPSAFGSRCSFPADEFPYADRIITDPAQALEIKEPNPAADGLLPFTLGRQRRAQPRLTDLGQKIRFSVSRGPLNIASFLMGATEFMMAIKTDPEPMHHLLRTITNFLKKWHALQREAIPTIDGLFMLDDIVGFIGEEDFLEFGKPYLQEIYAADVKVKFFHNDAPCAASIRHYADIGINLYNPGIQNTIQELRTMGGSRLTLLGNIPPRDVLAKGTPDDVARTVRKMLADNPDRTRWVLSCGGGMPPGTRTENIRAFLAAAAE